MPVLGAFWALIVDKRYLFNIFFPIFIFFRINLYQIQIYKSPIASCNNFDQL